MIDGLAPALEEAREHGVPELELALAEVISGPATLAGLHTFKRGVHRLELQRGGTVSTLVVKRLRFDKAQRNELAFGRWLPAVGLEGACPALLGRCAERHGKFFWHVYEDVGDGALATDPPDATQVAAIAQLVARLHSRFSEHPILTEVRMVGGDLGLPFFAGNVSDALHGLHAVRARRCGHRDRAALLARLIDRLEALAASLPRRADAFRAHAGPETLLHGDLWTTNTFAAGGARRTCLIDWDHAGAGPACYDVSTFLMRFPREHRAWVFRLYCDALDDRGWRPPGVRELNVLFETAEVARYANHVCWTALVLSESGPDWAWEALREVERWFEALAPMLPDGDDAMAAERA
jgi:hypothetical protein